MQGPDRVLAGRYGKALFQAAEDQSVEERVHEEIVAAERALSEAAHAAYLGTPRVSAADKKARIKEVLGAKTHQLTLRFLELLIDKKRFGLLPLMGAMLERFIAEKKNKGVAKVHSAVAISAEAQEALKSRLKVFSGRKEIELDIEEDPELIAGLVVRLGDWVIDASLKGQLARLKEAFHGN